MINLVISLDIYFVFTSTWKNFGARQLWFGSSRVSLLPNSSLVRHEDPPPPPTLISAQPRQIEAFLSPFDASMSTSPPGRYCNTLAFAAPLYVNEAASDRWRYQVHPSSPRRQRQPSPSSDPDAAASPSHATGGSAPASIWTRCTFPRSKSSPPRDGYFVAI